MRVRVAPAAEGWASGGLGAACRVVVRDVDVGSGTFRGAGAGLAKLVEEALPAQLTGQPGRRLPTTALGGVRDRVHNLDRTDENAF